MGILIVDDDEDTRAIMARLLTNDGFQDVATAESAEQAFSLLFSDAPVQFDLIFLDVNMPNLDGIVSCARIREHTRYRTVPIVMTTARAEITTIDRAFRSGATDYLTKPLKAMDFLACVRAKLRLKAELDRRDLLESELAKHAPFYFLKSA
jgi:phosphoserine phosphatase RsbU/P